MNVVKMCCLFVAVIDKVLQQKQECIDQFSRRVEENRSKILVIYGLEKPTAPHGRGQEDLVSLLSYSKNEGEP